MDAPAPEARPAPRAPARHGWLRANTEALAVAVVLALVIKHFAFEAFQVPTESMEPTIIGRNLGGDHIIVSKLGLLVREPARFDVIVFRYPLARLVSYVKRVVGLPGEEVEIVRGDVFVTPAGGGQALIARKPAVLQEAIFEHHPALPPEAMGRPAEPGFRTCWDVPAAGAAFVPDGLALHAGPAPRLVTLAGRVDITNDRFDGRAGGASDGAGDLASGTAVRIPNPEPVGDLRLSVTVTPEPTATAVVLRIVDCTQVDRPIALSLAVRGSGRPSRLEHGRESLPAPLLAAAALEPGRPAQVQIDNVDDRIRVSVDGRELAVHDYLHGRDGAVMGASQVAFGLEGGSALFHEVEVCRDLHYTSAPGAGDHAFRVPEGHYLVLGDNSPASLDGRGWRAIAIRHRESDTVLVGDLDGVSDDVEEPRPGCNPWIDRGGAGVAWFADVLGNRWRLAEGSFDLLDIADAKESLAGHPAALHGRPFAGTGGVRIHQERVTLPAVASLAQDRETRLLLSAPSPFVPRTAVIGRAALVFLPLARAGLIR